MFGFHEILLHISSLFLNDDLDTISDSAHKSFELINQTINVERIQVHVFDHMHNCSQLYYQHVSKERFRIDLSHVDLESIENAVKMINQGLHVFTRNVNELSDSNIKRMLIQHGTKSVLIIPMCVRNESIGFIAFESLSRLQQDYSAEAISLLKIYANMLANLITRGRDREQLKELVEKIAVQNKRHADFSFITSHNIRASVANLMALTDLIQEDTSIERFEMLKTTVDRLNSNLFNINEILNGERHDHLKKKSCSIRNVADNVIFSYQYTIKSKCLKVINLIDNDVTITTFPGYLDNILRQLIFNSIKFSKEHGEKSVIISSHVLENRILLKIVDNGKGFDAESNQHKVFEVGSRFHPEQCDGNGMGLFMSKLQVEALGGEIELSSLPGEGTSVFIYLPKED